MVKELKLRESLRKCQKVLGKYSSLEFPIVIVRASYCVEGIGMGLGIILDI